MVTSPSASGSTVNTKAPMAGATAFGVTFIATAFVRRRGRVAATEPPAESRPTRPSTASADGVAALPSGMGRSGRDGGAAVATAAASTGAAASGATGGAVAPLMTSFGTAKAADTTGSDASGTGPVTGADGAAMLAGDAAGSGAAGT